MPSSAVRSFSDADDYAATIRNTKAEINSPLRNGEAAGIVVLEEMAGRYEKISVGEGEKGPGANLIYLMCPVIQNRDVTVAVNCSNALLMICSCSFNSVTDEGSQQFVFFRIYLLTKL